VPLDAWPDPHQYIYFIQIASVAYIVVLQDYARIVDFRKKKKKKKKTDYGSIRHIVAIGLSDVGVNSIDSTEL
jgi:hypothetical protein